MRHDFPDGYPPLNYCRGCGRDFAGLEYFDRHRSGSFEYSYAEGVKGPWVWDSDLNRRVQRDPTEDGRRCLDDNELLAKGLRPMSREEMLSSRRHRKRAQFDVPLWHDPVAAERLRSVFAEEE